MKYCFRVDFGVFQITAQQFTSSFSFFTYPTQMSEVSSCFDSTFQFEDVCGQKGGSAVSEKEIVFPFVALSIFLALASFSSQMAAVVRASRIIRRYLIMIFFTSFIPKN